MCTVAIFPRMSTVEREIEAAGGSAGMRVERQYTRYRKQLEGPG